MEFVVEGSGSINLIFLHGWGADFKSFYYLKDILKNCTLHFATLDGFGSTCEPYDVTICGYSQRLHNYILSNNLKNIVLVGHSFGGRVAIEYAYKYNLVGLVLVDSAGIMPKFSIKKWIKICNYKRLKRKVGKHILPSSVLDKYGSQDYKNASHQMKKVLNCCVRYNQKPLLKSINCPTLIVWGEKDNETPIYMAKTLHKGIKNSKLVVMQSCGHFSFLDNPYYFYKLLNQFLLGKGDNK